MREAPDCSAVVSSVGLPPGGVGEEDVAKGEPLLAAAAAAGVVSALVLPPLADARAELTAE
jgi:hypothetical protein